MAEPGDVATGPGWELRCGRWQVVLDNVEANACITDPPYGARTHQGHDHDARDSSISYDSLTFTDAASFARYWSRRHRVGSWVCIMTSHDLVPAIESAMAANDRYVFAPVPLLQHRPRLTGDGPGSGAIPMVVSRPRESRFMRWGSLPCWYMSTSERGAAVVGAKPLELMRAIVRDYSRPGDLIVDPCAGGGTTLLAAVMEGRRAIGAEMDPETFEKAAARLRRGYTPDLFASVADKPEPEQTEMFDGLP